jgi:hypothetical protein
VWVLPHDEEPMTTLLIVRQKLVDPADKHGRRLFRWLHSRLVSRTNRCRIERLTPWMGTDGRVARWRRRPIWWATRGDYDLRQLERRAAGALLADKAAWLGGLAARFGFGPLVDMGGHSR